MSKKIVISDLDLKRVQDNINKVENATERSRLQVKFDKLKEGIEWVGSMPKNKLN